MINKTKMKTKRKEDKENLEDILDIAELDQTCFDYNSHFYSHLRNKSNSNKSNEYSNSRQSQSSNETYKEQSHQLS